MIPILKLVTIIVPTFNREASIVDCIESLLAQTYTNFEIIICDDNSDDSTVANISLFGDKRIRLIRRKVNGGPALARNEAILAAGGDIIFFTDDDVIVPKNWISSGLIAFNDDAVLGVEGKITYVSDDYVPRYSDRVVQNLTGGLYMTANIAYRKKVLIDVGLFDPEMRQYEDRCLAFKIIKKGKIIYVPTFNVIHQRESYNTKSFMREGAKVKYRVLSLDRIDDNTYFTGLFYQPLKFLFMLLPPLLLARIRTHRFETLLDWKLLFLAYPRFYYERIVLWRAAFKRHRFLI